MKEPKRDKIITFMRYKHSMLIRAVACLLIFVFTLTNIAYAYENLRQVRYAETIAGVVSGRTPLHQLDSPRYLFEDEVDLSNFVHSPDRHKASRIKSSLLIDHNTVGYRGMRLTIGSLLDIAKNGLRVDKVVYGRPRIFFDSLPLAAVSKAFETDIDYPDVPKTNFCSVLIEVNRRKIGSHKSGFTAWYSTEDVPADCISRIFIFDRMQNMFIDVTSQLKTAFGQPPAEGRTSTTSETVEDILIEEIRKKGRITFAEFMEISLYSDQGFYMQNVSIGVRTDESAPSFETYSERFSPVFGQCMARQIIEMWENMDKPDGFRVVEMGAGNGTMAKDILEYIESERSDLYNALEYTIVEISPRLTAMQETLLSQNKEKVRWIKSSALDMDEKLGGGIEGVFISNELIDAFPVHRVQCTHHSVKELYITHNGRRFIEEWGEVSDPAIIDYLDNVKKHRGLSNIPKYPYDTAEIEVNLNAVKWQHVLDNALKRGYVISADYGESERDEMPYGIMEGGSIIVHSPYIKGNPRQLMYAYPGKVDISSRVDFFTLLNISAESSSLAIQRMLRQEDFLRGLGMPEHDIGKLDHVSRDHGSYIVAIQSKGDVRPVATNIRTTTTAAPEPSILSIDQSPIKPIDIDSGRTSTAADRAV